MFLGTVQFVRDGDAPLRLLSEPLVSQPQGMMPLSLLSKFRVPPSGLRIAVSCNCFSILAANLSSAVFGRGGGGLVLRPPRAGLRGGNSPFRARSCRRAAPAAEEMHGGPAQARHHEDRQRQPDRADAAQSSRNALCPVSSGTFRVEPSRRLLFRLLLLLGSERQRNVSSRYSPQCLHLRAARRMTSLQNGHRMMGSVAGLPGDSLAGRELGGAEGRGALTLTPRAIGRASAGDWAGARQVGPRLVARAWGRGP